jgi:hypothetical protein
MGASRGDGDRTDEQLAWAAVRGKVRKVVEGPAEEVERVLAPAVAAAVADMTAEERALLRRKGKLPDWFAGEVRRHFQQVELPNLDNAQVKTLTSQDADTIKHLQGAGLGAFAAGMIGGGGGT